MIVVYLIWNTPIYKILFHGNRRWLVLQWGPRGVNYDGARHLSFKSSAAPPALKKFPHANAKMHLWVPDFTNKARQFNVLPVWRHKGNSRSLISTGTSSIAYKMNEVQTQKLLTLCHSCKGCFWFLTDDGWMYRVRIMAGRRWIPTSSWTNRKRKCVSGMVKWPKKSRYRVNPFNQ